MSFRSISMSNGICPVTLARKLALLRIEQQNRCYGVSESYCHILNDFRTAMRERESHEEAIDIIIHYGYRLQKCGKLVETKRLYRTAVDELGQIFGRHHSSTLFVTFQRGKLLQRVRQFKTAERMYNQVLKGMDDRNPYKMYFSNELGVVYAEQYRLTKAERAFQRALYKFTGIWGTDHLWTYTAAINLSDIYRTQGRPGDAATLLYRGLVGLEKLLGDSNKIIIAKAPRFVKIYTHYRQHGRLDNAREICEVALPIFEKHFGKDSEMTLQVVWDMAQICRDQGRLRESKLLMDRAIVSLRDSGHASEPALFGSADLVCN